LTQPSHINIDFGAASEQVARLFDPEIYTLKIKNASARRSHNGNFFVVFHLIELKTGGRVSLHPLWVDGPNADAGLLAAENRHVIAQILSGAGLPTSGNAVELIPKLAGHEFVARLVLAPDSRTGRTFNSVAEVMRA